MARDRGGVPMRDALFAPWPLLGLALGIAEGTLRSRLNAGKDALFALAEPLLPVSQRGPR